jgi:hypothetical protein
MGQRHALSVYRHANVKGQIHYLILMFISPLCTRTTHRMHALRQHGVHYMVYFNTSHVWVVYIFYVILLLI